MLRSPLADLLLEDAEKIRTACGGEVLNASHVALAAVEYCSREYTGICISDRNFQLIPFEEERLRLAFSKTVKLKGYLKNLLSRAEFQAAPIPFASSLCEKISEKRNSSVLSADALFLCALAQLPEKAEKVIAGALTEAEIQGRLEEIDREVFDFVLESLEKVRLSLNEKAKMAKEMRDRKSAEKIAEPEELREMLFSAMELRETGNRLEMKIPEFFGRSALKLNVHYVDGVWYVHDNGCAIRHLSRSLKDDAKLSRVVKKVCHSGLIQKGKIVGNFSNAFRFFYYLQRLVFIAHGDLFYTRLEKALYEKDSSEVYVPLSKAEPLDRDLLAETLKKGIWASYDENKGLLISFDMLFSLFSTRPSFALQPMDGGMLCITDGRRGKTEGEIFEAFYWDHEDFSPYSDFIRNFTDRFGGEFDGESVSLTDKKEKLFSALCRFFQMAVLLSELGGKIALPKPSKEKR